MGNYATPAAATAFGSGASDRHATELASLAGSRLIIASETNVGRGWDEARVKSWSAGDQQRARKMYQDEFNFHPVGKLMFVGNHPPKLSTVDEGLRRRIHVVPFTFKPATPDLGLGAALRHEAGGILAWAVQGCADWQTTQLGTPKVVADRTATYFEEEDTIGLWLQERTKSGTTLRTNGSDLWANWQQWCSVRSEPAGRMNDLSRELQNRGYRKHKTRKCNVWAGLTLVTDDFSDKDAA
jgi:putative DNA primase/helicase